MSAHIPTNLAAVRAAMSPRQRNAVNYQEREKMARAVIILTNHQLLMKYATANNQSIPATRLYFEKVAAGACPPPIITNWAAAPANTATMTNTVGANAQA